MCTSQILHEKGNYFEPWLSHQGCKNGNFVWFGVVIIFTWKEKKVAKHEKESLRLKLFKTWMSWVFVLIQLM